MFENGHDAMRQTQNGFGKQWKPGDQAQAHGNLDGADDSDENDVGDDDDEDDDPLQEDGDEMRSDHDF